VNAAGAHAGVIMSGFGVKREYPLLKAMSLFTTKPASDIALAAPASEGRMLTLVPWRGRALVGTSQSKGFAQPGDTGASVVEVERLVADANTAFPALKLTPPDVTLVQRGVVPAVLSRAGTPELRMIPGVYDHAAEGAPGAFTVLSAKYSSARGIAERVTNMVARRLGKRTAPSRTATTVLPGAGIADHEALAIETARAQGIDLPIAAVRHLIGRYAERAADVIGAMRHGALRETLTPTEPTMAAEVVYVIREEMALRLTDIIVRRTGAGATGHPGQDVVKACARIAAAELGWNADRIADEIAAVDRVYAISG
jgi:glycerol-3-phosphate dehydrogenase